MQPFDVNGSWLVGVCATCGDTRLYRSGISAPQTDRDFCKRCCTFTLDWGWIRIDDAHVTDGDAPKVNH